MQARIEGQLTEDIGIIQKEANRAPSKGGKSVNKTRQRCLFY